MAQSEKRCCLPLFFDVRGFQDLMTVDDIHSVNEPYVTKGLFVFLPVGDLVFLLELWITASFVLLFHIRLLF